MKSLIAAAMLSTAVLRMMPDAGGGSDGPDMSPEADREARLRNAVGSLNDADDKCWLADGRPRMEAVEAAFGDTTLTREEVDAIGRVRQTLPPAATTEAETAPPPPPPADNAHVADGASKFPEPEQPPVQRQKPSPCRMVMLTFAEKFDGETSAPGMVLKVYDDGTINVKAFAPNGGADRTVTGVMHAEDVAAMADGADKNAALSVTWDWPPRV